MEHPKRKGDRTTLAVMTSLHDAGHDLYVPFGENTRCDLIVDRGDDLIRVQCKTGRLRQGVVIFAVSSSYAHHRNPEVARRTYTKEVDYFAVYCRETSEVYLVPLDEVPMKCEARLRIQPPLNNQRDRVRFAADYLVGKIAIDGLRGPSGA